MEENKENKSKKEDQEKKQILPTCVLCYDECKFIGLPDCNHKYFCHKCVYKMRKLSKIKTCPICNNYNDYNQNDLRLFDIDQQQQSNQLSQNKSKKGIFVANPYCNKAMLSIIQFSCFAPNCQDTNSYSNLNLLKKHLKEKHQRFLCDICLEFKKCLLSEHQLYNKAELDRHFHTGDLDQEDNIYFFHPYCKFCDKVFYDEEKLVQHMTNHFTCHLCSIDKKYYYYNQYDNLEIHFSMSHYLCEQQQCHKSFTAFKTLGELEHHQLSVHKIGFDDSKSKQQQQYLSNISLQNMVGFKFDDQNDKKKNFRKKEEPDQILDQEGYDFEDQFLSLRKNKKNYEYVDDHKDDIFDFREFYIKKYDDENIQQEDLLQVILNSEGYQRPGKKGTGNSGVRQQKIQYIPRQKQDKIIYLEDIKFLQYNPNQQVLVDDKQLNNYLESIFNQDQWDQYHSNIQSFFKLKIKSKEFFEKFMELCGQELGYRLFPIFIKTIQNQKTAQELDHIYLEEIAKLPKRTMNILNTSDKYSDFFKFFLKELENNFIARIKEKRIKMKEKIKVDKNRLIQFIQILRRTSVHEMAKLKFISNFGLSLEGIDYVWKKIYFIQIDKIQEKINKVPSDDFIKLYQYIFYCNEFIQGRNQARDHSQISSLVFKDFFNRNPEIVEQYCKKYKSHLSDNSNDEDKKKKKHPIQNIPNPQFDTKCQFEFPELKKEDEKIINQKKSQQKQQDSATKEKDKSNINKSGKKTEWKDQDEEVKIDSLQLDKQKQKQQKPNNETPQKKEIYKNQQSEDFPQIQTWTYVEDNKNKQSSQQQKQQIQQLQHKSLDSDQEDNLSNDDYKQKPKQVDIKQSTQAKSPQKSNQKAEDYPQLCQQQKKQEDFETFEEMEQAQQNNDFKSWNNQTNQIYKYENLNQTENIKQQLKEDDYFPTLPADKKQNKGTSLIDDMKKVPNKKVVVVQEKQVEKQEKKKGKYKKIQLENDEDNQIEKDTYLDDNCLTIEQIQYLQLHPEKGLNDGIEKPVSKNKEAYVNLEQQGEGYPDLSSTTAKTIEGKNILEQIQSKPQGKKNKYYQKQEKQQQIQKKDNIKQDWNDKIAEEKKISNEQQEVSQSPEQDKSQQNNKSISDQAQNPKEYPTLEIPKSSNLQQDEKTIKKVKDQWEKNDDNDDEDDQEQLQPVGKKKYKGKQIVVIKGGFN